MPESPRIPLLPGRYYHLFNRGVNRTTIFDEAADYERFLWLVRQHILPVGRVYSYALLRDHWHLCISTFPAEKLPPHRLKDKHALGRVVGHLQNAYAKYFNHKYRRVSGLFEHKYERVEVTSVEYFRTLVLYHHFNPQKHDLIDYFDRYPWSSYQHLRDDAEPTFLAREVVWQKFGGRAAFQAAHQQYEHNFWEKLGID